MTYTCTEPRCRWKRDNGDHPDLPHAVWWGCTPRPPAPLRKGDVVRRTGLPDLEPEVVATVGWDEGRGWQITFCHHGWFTGPNDPADYEVVGGHVQPDIFELLETA